MSQEPYIGPKMYINKTDLKNFIHFFLQGVNQININFVDELVANGFIEYFIFIVIQVVYFSIFKL